MAWLIWGVVAIAAMVGEIFTLGLYLAPFAVSALLVAALSPFLAVPFQIASFVAVSLVLLLLVRPVVWRVLPLGNASDTAPRIGPSEPVGTVVDRVDRGHGQIRVGSAEFWSARPAEADLVMLPGQEVEIVGMDGVSALVRPIAHAQTRVQSTDASELDSGAAPYGLSPREVEVLRLICEGRSNQEIAETLFLSPRTVHHHVSHILNKMGADNRVEAMRMAMDSGLVRSSGPER